MTNTLTIITEGTSSTRTFPRAEGMVAVARHAVDRGKRAIMQFDTGKTVELVEREEGGYTHKPYSAN